MLIKYPTKSRPLIFQRTLSLYLQDPTVTVLVTADVDDLSMNNHGMHFWIEGHDRVKIRWGNSRTKVEAINDGLADEGWDGICIVGSDDMVPQRPDYAQRIAALYEQHFPQGDGVLHLNDGRTGRALNTIPVLDRAYFNRFGYVYRPASLGDGYKSVWCDNEFQEVSERLGRAVYVDEVIIRHDWIGASAPDALHRHNEGFHEEDAAVHQARKAAGFPKQSLAFAESV